MDGFVDTKFSSFEAILKAVATVSENDRLPDD